MHLLLILPIFFALEPKTIHPPPLQWHCIQAQPKREHIAAGALERTAGDIEVFCPKIRFRKVTQRGPVWFTEAMFPGYFFARFDFQSRHRLVRHSLGVTTIVHFGDAIATLPDEVMSALRERCLADGDDSQPVVLIDEAPTVGKVIRVAEGAFLGLEAVVTQVLSSRDRVRILVEFLGRQVEAVAEARQLVPARLPGY